MSAKPRSRNWNDVQTAIATTAIVATLGLWNLFATAPKVEAAQASEPIPPPPTEPPIEPVPTAMPQVKIMFTQQAAPQSTVVQQVQASNQQQQKKKKKNKNNDNGGGSVTQTKSS